MGKRVRQAMTGNLSLILLVMEVAVSRKMRPKAAGGMVRTKAVKFVNPRPAMRSPEKAARLSSQVTS
jgi:hypothetical protein